MNKISCKMLFLDTLKTYHLPKELSLRAYNVLYTDPEFRETKNIDNINLENLDKRRFCCNIDKIIIDGERY